MHKRENLIDMYGKDSGRLLYCMLGQLELI